MKISHGKTPKLTLSYVILFASWGILSGIHKEYGEASLIIIILLDQIMEELNCYLIKSYQNLVDSYQKFIDENFKY